MLYPPELLSSEIFRAKLSRHDTLRHTINYLFTPREVFFNFLQEETCQNRSLAK